MAASLFERWSPEHALHNTINDMKESGLDGLKKHLTENALKNLQSIESISDMPEIAMITSALMVGTVELTMIKEKKIWKIDRLAMPKFEKFTLSLEK